MLRIRIAQRPFQNFYCHVFGPPDGIFKIIDFKPEQCPVSFERVRIAEERMFVCVRRVQIVCRTLSPASNWSLKRKSGERTDVSRGTYAVNGCWLWLFRSERAYADREKVTCVSISEHVLIQLASEHSQSGKSFSLLFLRRRKSVTFRSLWDSRESHSIALLGTISYRDDNARYYNDLLHLSKLLGTWFTDFESSVGPGKTKRQIALFCQYSNSL